MNAQLKRKYGIIKLYRLNFLRINGDNIWKMYIEC